MFETLTIFAFLVTTTFTTGEQIVTIHAAPTQEVCATVRTRSVAQRHQFIAQFSKNPLAKELGQIISMDVGECEATTYFFPKGQKVPDIKIERF